MTKYAEQINNKIVPLFVVRKTNKNGRLYNALVAKLGYREAFISFDDNLIAELCGVSLRELYEAPTTQNGVVYAINFIQED